VFVIDIKELESLRQDFLLACQDEEKFISQEQVLDSAAQYMLDSKIIDTEEFSSSYLLREPEKLKINAYLINDSGERLQVFIIDESHLKANGTDDYVCTQRVDYEVQFNRALNAVKYAIDGTLSKMTQLSDPIGVLANLLRSEDGFSQIDVVEIILISLTATASKRQENVIPKDIYFGDEKLTVSRGETKKDLLVVRTLVNLNFFHKVMASNTSNVPLVIDFDKTFNRNISVLKAASSDNFHSYLCVFDAELVADIYKRYSSRLLDRNVRSFLGLQGKNKGMRETMRLEPERFIAYNNGLTITATDMDLKKTKSGFSIGSLTDFQIVNGGQTTATIYFSRKDGIDVSKVSVMAKINVVRDLKTKEVDTLISNISQFSNTQSLVTPIDLRSRNKELVELKKLSGSVVTPSARKWFFERSRGEYSTAMKLAGSKGAGRFKRDQPKERLFTKDQLAKAYMSWGDEPWFVKLGGGKIFRKFLEKISTSPESENSVKINRDFYEILVGKIILVNTLTSIYGVGKKSMGQLRSAAVPYSMALLYMHSDGSAQADKFNFLRIWQEEKIPQDLHEFCIQVLILANSLLKQYSKSDDVPQYSKNIELWLDIKKSPEVKKFFSEPASQRLINKYCC